MYSSFYCFTNHMTMELFRDELGLAIKTERGGRVFPQSDKASDVTAALLRGLNRYNVDIKYSFIYTGRRYSQQENIRYNHVEPWYTSDLSASYHYDHWRVTLEVNNLLSQDYDVILNYPMPKRNAAVTLEYKL